MPQLRCFVSASSALRNQVIARITSIPTFTTFKYESTAGTFPDIRPLLSTEDLEDARLMAWAEALVPPQEVLERFVKQSEISAEWWDEALPF